MLSIAFPNDCLWKPREGAGFRICQQGGTHGRPPFDDSRTCSTAEEAKLTGGDSNLSIDVRLSTSNVSPSQRKAIRSILTDVGVRVVANKKTYVIEAKVEEESAFDLSDVPVAGRREYYELKIHGSKVTVRAPEQEGTVWAAQTLATLFKVVVAGGTRRNDYSRLANLRCAAFSSKIRGSDRMMLIDWSDH